MDNKIFLGCYGKYPPPYSMEAEKIENYGANVLEINEERDSLCDSLKDIKFDKSVDGLTILAFSGNKYWTIEHFPENPVITKSNITSEKWRGFHSSPDTVLLVPEGQHLRGTLFEFKGGKYSQWGTTGKLLGKDQQSVKFKTIIHNSDVVEPVAVAFDKEEVSPLLLGICFVVIYNTFS